MALLGKGNRIGSFIDKRVRSEILSYLPRSLEIWDKSIAEFVRVEKANESPYRLNEERKAYTIDGIVVSKALGLNLEKVDFALQAYNIYYLSVHLLDDLMEDPTKFYTKFKYKGEAGKERRIRTSGASFIYNANITVHNILEQHGKLQNANSLGTEIGMNESLAKMVKFFEIKSQALTQDNIIEIKNRKVSGEAAAFFLEFVKLENSHAKKINSDIRDAVMYLGSLTQFTDDLRDLDEDRRKKNTNLLLSLRGLKEDATHEWARLYYREEQNMVNSIDRSKMTIDIDMLKALPWYPFFAKRKLEGLLRR